MCRCFICIIITIITIVTIYIIKNVLYITDCKDAAGELHTVEVEMHAERQ